MMECQAVAAADIAALRDNLCAAQQGAQAPYRSVLAWVARRAEAHAAAHGRQAETIVCAALQLVHGLRHTYDPRRDSVAWVDALIAHAAVHAPAAQPATAADRDREGVPVRRMHGRRTP